MKKILSTMLLGSILLSGASSVVSAVEGDNQTDTSKASIQFTGGALSLESVSDLNFGSHKIGESETLDSKRVYQSTADQTAVVSDYRGLAEGEWKLNAKISSFQDENNNETLSGFALAFADGEAKADNGTITKDESNIKNPILSSDSSEDGTENFVSFTQGDGNGRWTNTWSNVQLQLLDGSETAGDHKATITWTLTDAVQ